MQPSFAQKYSRKARRAFDSITLSKQRDQLYRYFFVRENLSFDHKLAMVNSRLNFILSEYENTLKELNENIDFCCAGTGGGEVKVRRDAIHNAADPIKEAIMGEVQTAICSVESELKAIKTSTTVQSAKTSTTVQSASDLLSHYSSTKAPNLSKIVLLTKLLRATANCVKNSDDPSYLREYAAVSKKVINSKTISQKLKDALSAFSSILHFRRSSTAPPPDESPLAKAAKAFIPTLKLKPAPCG